MMNAVVYFAHIHFCKGTPPMSVKAAPEVESSISTDDFQALEEKIYRTIELLKQAREGQAVAEREARRLREQVSGRDQETESLRREVVALRREREEVRGRVEKMLKQIDALTADDSARYSIECQLQDRDGVRPRRINQHV